ncbi:unnamed protein product [Paramecium primaurelia]|uniref:Uncharacterized protein n=1 Tax=Paramecium primaurelia TaxID=5886 RepID=A0A8S1MPW2_PARPR|nr:unnamed protein product [Paramecium primaurelia]
MSHNSIHCRKIQLSLQKNYIQPFYKNIKLRIQISHNLSMKNNQIPVSLIVNQFQSSLFINMIQTLSINSNLNKINNSCESYPSYYQINLYVNNNNIETKKQILQDNRITYCKILEINVNEEYIDQDLEFIIIVNLNKKMKYLKNNINQLQYQHSIIVQVNNQFDFEYQYFGNTVKMNIVFHIKSHFQLKDIEMDFL